LTGQNHNKTTTATTVRQQVTHLLKIACPIVKLECILRAKRSNTKPDRKKKVVMYNHHAEGELEADPSVSSITSQQQCRKNIENIDKLVLGLAGRHTRTWNNGSDKLKLKLGKLQVSLGYQLGYPKGTIESFVGHSSIGLQRPPAILI
jgi:CRISPR/Cas system CSM-associated protein Csm2 small subunit